MCPRRRAAGFMMGWLVAGPIAMAQKGKKKKDNSGIQQAAGLIRYFDEESEEAWKITKGQVFFACISLSLVLYLFNLGFWEWLLDKF